MLRTALYTRYYTVNISPGWVNYATRSRKCPRRVAQGTTMALSGVGRRDWVSGSVVRSDVGVGTDTEQSWSGHGADTEVGWRGCRERMEGNGGVPLTSPPLLKCNGLVRGDLREGGRGECEQTADVSGGVRVVTVELAHKIGGGDVLPGFP